MFLGPQTLKTWHMDRKTGLLAEGEQETPAERIPENGLMGLYPSNLNQPTVQAFYERVPAEMKLRHGLFVSSAQAHTNWVQQCMHQASSSISCFVWSGAMHVSKTSQLEMPMWSMSASLDPWGVLEPFSEKKLTEKNTDLGWLCSETGFPIDRNGDYFTKEQWIKAYESELIDISKDSATSELNWSILLDVELRNKRRRIEKKTRRRRMTMAPMASMENPRKIRASR